MAANRTNKPAKDRSPTATEPAPRLRLKLSTIEDVKRELARLYRSAKAGQMEVGDASRLANILSLLGRMIEGADLERRIAAIEAAQPASEGSASRCH